MAKACTIFPTEDGGGCWAGAQPPASLRLFGTSSPPPTGSLGRPHPQISCIARQVDFCPASSTMTSRSSPDISSIVRPDNSSIAGNGSKQNEQRQYQRAYKACTGCRKRKAKCELVAGTTGPPCVKCRRELRECIFTAERAWAKRQKGNTPPTQNASSSTPPTNRDYASNSRGLSHVAQEQSHRPSGQQAFQGAIRTQLENVEVSPPSQTPSQVRGLRLRHGSLMIGNSIINLCSGRSILIVFLVL